MNDSANDWKREMEEASKESARTADEAIPDQIEEIGKQAERLTMTFRNLKMTDQETYDALVAIVDESTQRNLSIGEVVTRVKALGEAGKRLAGTIENLSPRGALAMLTKTLKE